MTSILDRHRERFQATPGDNRAFEALEEHLFLAGEWDAVIALYEHRLTAPALQANPMERAQVRLRMGQVYDERLGNSERALECFTAVLRDDPQNRAALMQLRSSHTVRGNWDVALQIGEVEVELPMRPAERAALLSELGGIWLDRLDDPQQASTLFEHALSEQPDGRVALEGAARAFARCDRHEEAAQAWERLTVQLKGPARAAAQVARARLLEGPLAQEERAQEVYRRALADDPDNRDAIRSVCAQARGRGQWPLLADLLERLFGCADDAAERVEIAVELGRLQREQLGDPDAARAWLGRADELGSDNAAVYEALADFERDRGDDDALLRCLERALALRAEAAPVSLLLEIATLYSDRGDDKRALALLQRATEQAPEDSLTVEALSDALARSGRDEDLVDVLERRAALAGADPEACAAALAELGALHEERLGDVEAALHAYRRAFEADAAAPGIAATVERLYRKAEDWEPLRDFLEVAGRKGPPDDRVATLCSLAALQADRFEDPEAAERALEDALRIDPGNPVAHRGLQAVANRGGDEETILQAYQREAEVSRDPGRLAFLVAEINRILTRREQPQAALEWTQRWLSACPGDRRALSACADLQEQLGAVSELAGTLAKLDALLASEEQAANRRRLGEAQAACGRVDAAIEAYRWALRADPDDAIALEALAIHLEAENRLAELAQTRRRLAELLPPERRSACLDELADLLSERLGDVAGAIEVLTQLASEPHAAADADDRLEAMLERGSCYEELAAHLDRRAAGLGEEATADDAAAILLRRANVLLDHLSDFDTAAAAYREVLRRCPDSATAQAGLERALRAGGDVAALAEFLAERASAAPDAAARERCAFERAVLLEESLSASDEARDEFRRLATTASQSDLRRSAGARLTALLEHSNDWPALREVLEALLPEADAAEQPEIHERLARLCRERLNDGDGTIAHLRAAADLAPERADRWRELAPLYEAAGRTRDFVDALEAEFAAGCEPDRELALRSHAAERCAADLDDAERARAHYERVLELEPSHTGAAAFIIDQCERAGDLTRVVQLLETQLAALDGAPRDTAGPWAGRRTSLRVRIAELHAQEFDDLDAAIAILEPALGEIGPEPVVADPLANLYERAGYRNDLVDLCRSAALACDVEAERANWYVRLGDSLRGSERWADAAAAYRQALTDRPGDRDVQAVLRDLYRRLGEDEPLARLLEVDLSRLAGADEVPVRLEIAELFAGSQDRPAEALVHLRRVLEIEPNRSEALTQALALAERLDLSDAMIELLDKAIALSQPAPDRAALLAQRGHLLAKVAKRPDDAISALREALTLDPSRRQDRTALRALLTAREDWAGVLDCIFREAGEAEGAERGGALALAAGIAWEKLSPDAALPWLERLRHERPDDAATAARISEAHRRADRPHALLRALEDEIAIGADSRDLHLERARIMENRLDSPARAIAALQDALRAAPGDVHTLKQLERLYRSTGRDRELAEVLEELLQHTSGEPRVALLCDLASLCEGPLADPQRAALHLLGAVAAARGSDVYGELLRALGNALREANQPEAWARAAEEELRVLDPDAAVLSDRRRELSRALAAAYEHELRRPDAALRHLRALVELKWTQAHGAGSEELDAIEQALLRLLRREESWVELEDRLSAHLERQAQDSERWRELAQLREERLRTPAAAAAAYRAVIEQRAGDVAAVRGLRRCAELAGDWGSVAEALELELDAAAPAAYERAALLRRLGDVCWRRLGSTTRASRCYAAALEASPHDLDALRTLQSLLEAMEDWRGALDLYESEVEMLGDREPERRRDAALRAGEIARDHTGEFERALRDYVHAAGAAELAPARRAELAELHQRNGDDESFAEVFAAWCDDPEAGARAGDHLRLAEVLEHLTRDGAALEQVERTLALDAESAPAWDAAARLRERCGEPAAAADALARSAALLPDPEAAPRLMRAAELSEPHDAEEALALFRAAARRDPGSAEICSALARVCSGLGDFAETVLMASRALDLDEADGGLDPEHCLATALIGARAAQTRGNAEAAADFYARAMAVAPENADALAGYGETLAGLGDLAGARASIEARLALDVPDECRALHLAMLGAALDTAGELDGACERLEEAIAHEPELDRAHADLVQLHERTDRIDEGVACLERWAAVARDPGDRALRLLRAAEWEMRGDGRSEAAERHLREALEADPELAHAWEKLATLLWEQGRGDAALEVTSLALDVVSDARVRGCVALIRGRALEQGGDRREAANAFAIAARENPCCIEAALSSARLLRGIGDWHPAADGLREFADRHPGGDAKGLADVLQQLGRLLAGPLEDVDGAIAAYRSAVEADPERVDSRASLAEFLSHRPGDRDEALSHHRELLSADPTHAPSLRVLLRIARDRGNQDAIAGGIAILRALGIASPREKDEALPNPNARLSFAGNRALGDPLWEKLRRLACETSREIATALGASETSSMSAGDDPVSAFRAAAMKAEGELAASALIPLTDQELGDVMKIAAAVVLDPEHVQGDGRLINAMSAAIRRRSRRRLRRILDGVSLAEIEQVDFAAWRSEVRALAAAVALEETDGELRTGLAVLIAEDSDCAILDLPDGADLTPYVAAYPRAQSLMRRVLRVWIDCL